MAVNFTISHDLKIATGDSSHSGSPPPVELTGVGSQLALELAGRESLSAEFAPALPVGSLDTLGANSFYTLTRAIATPDGSIRQSQIVIQNATLGTLLIQERATYDPAEGAPTDEKQSHIIRPSPDPEPAAAPILPADEITGDVSVEVPDPLAGVTPPVDLSQSVTDTPPAEAATPDFSADLSVPPTEEAPLPATGDVMQEAGTTFVWDGSSWDAVA